MFKSDEEISSQTIKSLRNMLNSERIQHFFGKGNYGVEIVYQDKSFRCANLYSEDSNGKPIMRTCALVDYLVTDNNLQSNEILAIAHKNIVEGASIGRCLTNSDFSIEKTPIYFGKIKLPKYLQQQMQMQPSAADMHIYKLIICKHKQKTDYCTIAEIHSPEYMKNDLLQKIYRDVYNQYRKASDIVDSTLKKLCSLDKYFYQSGNDKTKAPTLDI